MVKCLQDFPEVIRFLIEAYPENQCRIPHSPMGRAWYLDCRSAAMHLRLLNPFFN